MINIYPGDFEESQNDENQELETRYQELQLKYQELEAKYQDLSQHYTALQKEYDAYRQSKSKAGRKPNDEKWTARYQAFAKMKDEGCKREDIQAKLNMSRATYFRYNKIYSTGGNADDLQQELVVAEVSEPTMKEVVEVVAEPTREPVIPSFTVVASAPVTDAAPVTEPETAPQTDSVTETVPVAPAAPEPSHEGLLLDEETGEYVTPEGLKRRRKLAEIRARRAAEEALKRQQAELEAAQKAAEEAAQKAVEKAAQQDGEIVTDEETAESGTEDAEK